MSVKTLTLEFVFEEDYDPDFDEVILKFAGVSLGDTNLTKAEREAVAEEWGQDDKFYEDTIQDILGVIDNGKPVSYS